MLSEMETILEVMNAENNLGPTIPLTNIQLLELPGSDRELYAHIEDTPPLEGIWLYHCYLPSDETQQYILGLLPKGDSRTKWEWRLYVADFRQPCFICDFPTDVEQIALSLAHLKVNTLLDAFEVVIEEARQHHRAGITACTDASRQLHE